jgi:hypothetical protein
MKKLIAVALVLSFVTFPLSSFAIVEGSQVLYEGGTAPGMKDGTMGTFDTSSEDLLVFNSPNGKLAIPYAKVTTFHYEEKLARRLGVILTLAVVMLKHRQRRHILTVSYTDEQGAPRVAVFEISKLAPETVVPVIQAHIKKCQVKPENAAARPLPTAQEPAAPVAKK